MTRYRYFVNLDAAGAEDRPMQAAQSNQRALVKQAVDRVPDGVVQIVAEVLAASEQPPGNHMIQIRFDRPGSPMSEHFRPTPLDTEPTRPINLLEAFQATGEPYLDALRRGREAQREILAAEGGVLTGTQVADLLGLSRQAVDKRRRAGHLIGVVTGRRGILYPVWQFDDRGPVPGLEVVLEDLRDHTQWSKILFMLTRNAWTDDEIPLHVLKRGEIEKVRRAAQMYLEHGAP